MFWYLVICILMVYPFSVAYVGQKTKKNTKPLALMCACSILWFFMAMRSTDIGVDTKYYSYVFTQFSKISLKDVFTAVTYATESETWAFDFEPGYRLLNKLVSYFSDSPQAITIFNSTLIMILLYCAIRRNTTNYMLAIWLYITLGIFQTEMNVTRNAIAILIVYNGFPYVQKKQFQPFCIYCLVASTIHVAALAFIPVYWLIHHVKITPSRCIAVVGCACVLGIVFPVISPYIQMMLPERLGKYFDGNNEKLGSLLVGILNVGMYVVSYLLLTQKEQKRVFSEQVSGVWMLVINACFFGVNIGLDDASRMAALFGPFLILSIPQMLGLMESSKRRTIAIAIVVLLCGCQYVMRLCINNIGGTMPYQFFW